jgi:choline dehydrogenase-like flavoprotein
MSVLSASICVVGSGPAGVVLALEMARAGHDVVLVESGGKTADEKTQALGDADIVNPGVHVAMNLATRRQIGGTSNIWGGRCVPYDPIDFDRRPYIPHSDWPISYDEIAGYFTRASRWFFTGDATFNTGQIPCIQRKTLVPGLLDGDVLSSTLERWSLPTNFGRHYGHELASTSGLRIASGLTCVEVMTDPEAKVVTGLRCRRLDGSEVRVEARHYVLACGGLETTRLLLASRSVVPRGLGNHSDMLGRFYMGHISGKIATIAFETPAHETAYSYQRDEERVYVRHRLSFSREALNRERLPNIVGWLVNPDIRNPDHGSGVLSFAYLALSSPFFGKRFIAEGIRQAAIGQGRRIVWPHLRNMLRDLPATLVFIPTFGYRRFLVRRKSPGFFVRSASNRYPLHYHAEQVPNPQSRVMLGNTQDALGMPRLAIDLRYTDQDVDGVVRAHALWDAHLRRHRCGRLDYAAGDLREKIWAQANDGYHQIGTTRMSRRPEDGVVDENLRVHHISNLHVASGSTFVTSGQANTTFMIVAFALRLADHLKRLTSG